MKIHYLIIFAFSGAILLGLAAGVYIHANRSDTGLARLDRNQGRIPKSDAIASISKSTILLLLAVGVIGALGVSRKKKDSGSDRAGYAGDGEGQRSMVNKQRKTDQP